MTTVSQADQFARPAVTLKQNLYLDHLMPDAIYSMILPFILV